MNTTRTNTVLLILLVVVSFSFSATLLQRNKGVGTGSSSSSKITLEGLKNDVKASFYNIYPSLVIPSDDIIISDTLSLIGADRKRHLLRDLVGSEPKLVLRYSQFDCETCVDSVISTVVKLTAKGKVFKEFILISNFRTERDFLIYDKYKKHRYPVYNISQKTLGLPIENKNLPFLFIINQDLRATKIFVPYRDLQYQTAEYLAYVFKLLKYEN